MNPNESVQLATLILAFCPSLSTLSALGRGRFAERSLYLLFDTVGAYGKSLSSLVCLAGFALVALNEGVMPFLLLAGILHLVATILMFRMLPEGPHAERSQTPDPSPSARHRGNPLVHTPVSKIQITATWAANLLLVPAFLNLYLLR